MRPLVSSQSSLIGPAEASPRKAAKAAGLAYLISFAIIAYVEFGVHQRFLGGDPILQPVDAAEAARNILAHEPLFRLGIALLLSYCVGVAVVIAAFYTILAPFGRTIALVAAISRLLLAGTWILATAELFDTLRLLAGTRHLGEFTESQWQALASLPLSIRWDHYYAGLLFWGLSTALFSYLWLKSRHIPKAFAAFGVVSGAWAMLCAFAFIANPAFANTINPWWFDTPLAIFEIVLSVVLLVKPIRT
ncbi:MAG TPA: DUF4386 domain-containing protein [Candidatus Limnocylindrales bacterium]|nr:DUF4386 domain-containing protein [Candidatus Limnocylindrales bacterium]